MVKAKKQKENNDFICSRGGLFSSSSTSFYKLPFGASLIKYQELSEAQFEKAAKYRQKPKLGCNFLGYRNVEEVLDEGFCNRVQE